MSATPTPAVSLSTGPTSPETYTVTTRSDRREVVIEADVSGAPVIDNKRDLETKHPITPDKVRLTYTRYGGRPWHVRATVYGKQSGPFASLMKGWAVYATNGGVDHWPDWLRALADQQHPRRPGGWPGDDPEGSYLP